MNIKIITRHSPSNYGSLLQSIATLRVVNELGHNAQIIDYIRDDECGLKAVITSLKYKQKWSGNFIKKILYIAVRYPEEKWAELRFNKMRKKYLYLTKRCSTHEDLMQLEADVFMTGSDQVWGPMTNGLYDSAFFLAPMKNGKKVSYAASFGRTEFSPEVIAAYEAMLVKYDKVTVRESSAVKLLNDWDIACEGQVLDPTLLLNAKQWGEYMSSPIKGDYVLIYEIHNNPQLDDYAKRFAKYVGLPLVRVSPTFHQVCRGGRFVFCPEVGTFLSYIKHAKFMLTDSFHGTAFAINLNVQFIEVLPNNKTGARNQSILQLTGLQNRIVTDFSDFSLAGKNIDFEKVNEVIRQERVKSMDLLNKVIACNI